MTKTIHELEALGKSLREIRSDLLKEEGGEQVRWYQGRRGTDLFAWLGEDGAASRLQLTFARSVVEWDRALGLRTGRMDSTSFGSGPGRFDTYLIRTDDKAQLAMLEAAHSVLLASPVDRILAAPLVAALEAFLEKLRAAAPLPAPDPAVPEKT